MSCATCNFYEPGKCIKDCLQIHFINDSANPNRFSVTIHKSEVAFIEINDKFLTVVDVDGCQHNYNLDIISHYHVPNFL